MKVLITGLRRYKNLHVEIKMGPRPGTLAGNLADAADAVADAVPNKPPTLPSPDSVSGGNLLSRKNLNSATDNAMAVGKFGFSTAVVAGGGLTAYTTLKTAPATLRMADSMAQATNAAADSLETLVDTTLGEGGEGGEDGEGGKKKGGSSLMPLLVIVGLLYLVMG